MELHCATSGQSTTQYLWNGSWEILTSHKPEDARGRAQNALGGKERYVMLSFSLWSRVSYAKCSKSVPIIRRCNSIENLQRLPMMVSRGDRQATHPARSPGHTQKRRASRSGSRKLEYVTPCGL